MNQTNIKHFTFYLRKMMKFYDLKVQGVPQALFLLLLAASFGIHVLLLPYADELTIYHQQTMVSLQSVLSQHPFGSQEAVDGITAIIQSEEYAQLISLMVKLLGFIFLQQAIIILLLFFYLGSYMVDLENEHPTFSQYFKKFVKALPRFIAFNILFYLCAGVLFLIITFISSFAAMIFPLLVFVIVLIPIGWFAVQVLFIFKDTVFLDTGVGVFGTFSVSLKLSSGYRIMIGMNIFFVTVLNWTIRLISARLVSGSNNVLILMFVISFVEIIVLLIRQRLTALMYIDRTRVEKHGPKEIDRL
ncbi:MAG: hypothetical protein GX045_00385 [Clostridiaceae bacterium]|nr:hypothetical protein [Clostridiaceae bacterium]